MKKVELKYGKELVGIDLSDANSVKFLNEKPMDEINDLKENKETK